MLLRSYQTVAVEQLREVLGSGKKRPICVAPTGSGKTTIAAWIIESAVSMGKRVLFVAHRKELIDQAWRRLAQFDIHAGVVMGRDKRTDQSLGVQVASVQTLVRRDPLDPPPDVVVMDECHRAVGQSYLSVVGHYPDSVVIGLTATPFRLDGRGLGEVFDSIVVVTTPEALILDGHLVPPKVYSPWSPNMKGVKIRAGEYAKEEAESRVMAGVGDMVDNWKRIASGKRTIVFAQSIKHSMAILQAFEVDGVGIKHVDGTTARKDRDAVLGPDGLLAKGDIDVVTNVGVVTEGFDCPAVECVVLGRPTASHALYLQMVGRGLRPFTDKEHALVLDFGGNVGRHGWPTTDLSDSYTLDGRMPRRKKADPSPVKTCEECFCVWPAEAGYPCPQCGWQPKVDPIDWQARKGVVLEHQQLGEEQLKKQRAKHKKHWDWLEHTRRMRGYKPGWAGYRFKAKFGYWPASYWRLGVDP